MRLKFELSFMKYGLAVVCRDVSNGVALKIHVPRYQIKLTRPEMKGESRKRDMRAEPPACGVLGLSPKMMALVVFVLIED